MSFKKEEIYKKRICKIELYPCPETLVAVGGGGAKPLILQAFLSEVLK